METTKIKESKIEVPVEWIEAIEREKTVKKISVEKKKQIGEFLKLYYNNKSLASISKVTGVHKDYLRKMISEMGLNKEE